MINTEMMLGYIVKGKHSIASVAENLGISELSLIKKIGNITDISVTEILELCHILRVTSDDCIPLFFAEVCCE